MFKSLSLIDLLDVKTEMKVMTYYGALKKDVDFTKECFPMADEGKALIRKTFSDVLDVMLDQAPAELIVAILMAASRNAMKSNPG